MYPLGEKQAQLLASLLKKDVTRHVDDKLSFTETQFETLPSRVTQRKYRLGRLHLPRKKVQRLQKRHVKPDRKFRDSQWDTSSVPADFRWPNFEKFVYKKGRAITTVFSSRATILSDVS
jgi:hypothetical protein